MYAYRSSTMTIKAFYYNIFCKYFDVNATSFMAFRRQPCPVGLLKWSSFIQPSSRAAAGIWTHNLLTHGPTSYFTELLHPHNNKPHINIFSCRRKGTLALLALTKKKNLTELIWLNLNMYLGSIWLSRVTLTRFVFVHTTRLHDVFSKQWINQTPCSAFFSSALLSAILVHKNILFLLYLINNKCC